MIEVSLISAFILGAMGSAHCLGMCGGIISALSAANDSKSQKWLKTFLYQFGRIASYTLIGALAGFVGLNVEKLSPIPILPVLSGVLMILMGLYLSRWWMGLTYVERAGAVIWRFINPLSKNFLPVDRPIKAISLGMLWGWLPCGLVYTALGYAITSAEPINSASYMLCFGLGTLPATLSVGIASTSIKSVFNNKYFRIISSLALIAFGVYILQDIFWVTEGSSGHQHHHH